MELLASRLTRLMAAALVMAPVNAPMSNTGGRRSTLRPNSITQQQRPGDDQHAGHDQAGTGLQKCLHDLPPACKPTPTINNHQSEFHEDPARGLGKSAERRPRRVQPAHQDARRQQTAGHAEPDRHALDVDRENADQGAKRDAESERRHIGLGDARFHRPEDFLQAAEAGLGSHHAEHIAALQSQESAERQQHAIAAHFADVQPVIAREMQIPESFADGIPAGDHHVRIGGG